MDPGSGTAWYDDLRLDEVAPQVPAPAWRILTLIYGSTDFSYSDSSGQHHVIGTTSRQQLTDAAAAATAFVTQDIPALDSGLMVPKLTIRYPEHPLTALDPTEDGRWPSPANTAADRDPGFDAVIVIWNPDVTDQATGQQRFIGGGAGAALDMGVGQTYTTLIMAAATSYGHRNVFKHEFGHSILSFFAAAQTAPQPPVNNHTDATTYVHCGSGQPYVWVDEMLNDPIPNSIYNNTSGFTHDYYSGTTALASDPTHCLGVTPLAWEYGGPLRFSQVTK